MRVSKILKSEKVQASVRLLGMKQLKTQERRDGCLQRDRKWGVEPRHG